MDSTAVVILNYNGIEHLRRFLPSVVKHTPECQLVVVDNKSTDTSVDFVRKSYPEIQVVLLDRNYGFSGGYNRGLQSVRADNYILLNSDVEVTEGWVDHLINYMRTNPEVAVCQPKILSLPNKGKFDYAGAAGGFVDLLGYPFCRGRVFDHIEEDQGQYNQNLNIFWAGGACFFIRSSVFYELGGFDEDFFAHMEEIDLCWRSQRAGYQTAYIHSSKVYHLGGGTLKDTNPVKTYLNFRNGLELLVKNTAISHLFWKLPCRLALDMVASIRFLLQGSLRHFLAVLKAEMAFWIRLPRTWAKRNKQPYPYISPLFESVIVWEYFIRGRKTFQSLKKQS